LALEKHENKMKKYDAIIIGAGQAGPSLAAKLVSENLNTAIIERKLFGGTCVNTGCIPTKTLVASARAAHMARRGKEFGVEISCEIKMDMKKVKARKDAVVRQSNQGVTGWMKNMDGLDVYEGHGRLEGPNVVNVNGEQLHTDKIFINVGARAHVPNMPGLNEIEYFTNSNIMDVDFLPEHLIIIGGSYIGLEFAQMYRRFGSEVTVIEANDRLISREDEDVSNAVKEILENEGVNVRLGAKCISFAKRDLNIAVTDSCNNEKQETIGTHVLLAVGRVPNTHDLGLDKTGVKVNSRGLIEVDDVLETNVPGIWAIGECNGEGAFTHTSYNDYEIVADNLFGTKTRRVSDRINCYGLFIDPPLGRVGLTEQQVKDSGKNALIGKMMMSRIGRAKERSETQGFMKVLIDAETDLILGANILGIGGDEVIHLFIDAMYANKPYHVIKNAVHIHPTVAELIPTMLQDLKELD
jgi:pyruvate/2-oxoglutarate dehydrogenase complex dihydrolipoamide dehydrogenase (E3) component